VHRSNLSTPDHVSGKLWTKISATVKRLLKRGAKEKNELLKANGDIAEVSKIAAEVSKLSMPANLELIAGQRQSNEDNTRFQDPPSAGTAGMASQHDGDRRREACIKGLPQDLHSLTSSEGQGNIGGSRSQEDRVSARKKRGRRASSNCYLQKETSSENSSL
jgi:hypothetical protein